MTSQEFAYWLQGFAELTDEAPSKAQWAMIKEHLQFVFKKETKLKLDLPSEGLPTVDINDLMGIRYTPAVWPNNPNIPHLPSIWPQDFKLPQTTTVSHEIIC